MESLYTKLTEEAEQEYDECKKSTVKNEVDRYSFFQGFYAAGRRMFERDSVIKFLRKELQKKTYCRKVMKQQYRELKMKLKNVEAKLSCYQYFIELLRLQEDFKAYNEIKNIKKGRGNDIRSVQD